jgi:hypothetical protein
MTSEEAMSFDPHSTDAMFAKVLGKLEEQGAMLTEIRENGRQTELEIAKLKSWRSNMQGQITVVSILFSVVAAFLVSYFTR